MSPIAQDDVVAIARDVFAAMVDGEEGLLTPSAAAPPGHDVAAWVDLHGPWAARASLQTTSGTAAGLTRALLRLPAGSPVTDDDLADALGEVANVVAGNVKALLPRQGTLGLPKVAPTLPDDTAVPVHRVPLDWRGASLVVTVWALPSGEPNPGRAEEGWEVR